MPAKVPKSVFLLKLELAHNGTIKRLRIPEYTKSDTTHRVRCTICNHVWPASGYTLTSKNPNGCPNCANTTKADNLITPLKDYLKQLKDIHGDTIKYVDGYIKVGSKANFCCTVCDHAWSPKCISLTKTNPHGCPECADRNAGLARIKTTAEFKQELFDCHGTSIQVLGEYVGCKDAIKVQCSLCYWTWDPMPDTLIGVYPHGCPECKYIKVGLANTKSKENYLKQLKDAHKGNITLISDYEKQSSNLQFKCRKKGHTWWTDQTYALIAPDPSGCPHCGNIVSKGESKLFKFIQRYAPDAQQSVRITKDPRTGGMLEWDIYIPSKNIAIEYNGVYFHSYPKKNKDYHLMKSQQSLTQHNVRVIHVTDLEWRHNTKVVKKTLKHILGITEERYFARKLTVVKRDKLTPARRAFYQKNHLQGDPTNGISYALVRDDGAIVALMSFATVQSVRGSVKKEGFYELVRYASKGSVVGGASRLFTAFLRDHNPLSILSYSQNDWFDGSIYPLLGFTKVKDCGHDYRTVWSNELRHKSYTRRSNLQKLLGSNFDPRVSEQQNLINNKVLILYDSGKIKWEWTTKDQREVHA